MAQLLVRNLKADVKAGLRVLAVAGKIADRMAVFDAGAGRSTASISAERHSAQHDIMIAGIALATDASLATRNTRDFIDVLITPIGPWTA